MAANNGLRKFATSKFAVLGGGISGLSAAFHLAKKVKDPGSITVIESSSRLGGWIKSVATEEGAIFEQGPRGMRPAGEQGLATLNMVFVAFTELRILVWAYIKVQFGIFNYSPAQILIFLSLFML